MQQIDIPTTWGTIVVQMLNGKVVSCTLPHLDHTPRCPLELETGSCNDAVSKFVHAALEGKQRQIPALGALPGTGFQHEVWKAIAAIRPGRTHTYSELAVAIGRPNAVRAIGTACGRNPVPLFIPCHRVVASDGGLGGFSAGLPWKKHLLRVEKALSVN